MVVSASRRDIASTHSASRAASRVAVPSISCWRASDSFAHLFLQGREHLLGLRHRRLAIAERLAIDLEARGQLLELLAARHQDRHLLGLLGRCHLDLRVARLDLGLLLLERRLCLAQLCDGLLECGPALVESPALLVEQVAIIRERRANLFRLGPTLAQVGFAGFLQDALVTECLFLAMEVFAHALEPRAQRRQHRLLPLEGGRALLDFARLRVHLPLGRVDFLALAAYEHVLLVEYSGLLLEVSRVALELLELPVDLERPSLELLLSALDARLDAVEPDEIRLVLLLPLLEGALGGSDRLLSRDQLGQSP